MTDLINHPPHYTELPPGVGLECIEYARHMAFTRGNAFKYLFRAGAKGDLQEDLGKAAWYLRAYAADISEAHELGDSSIPDELLDTIDVTHSARSSILWLIAYDAHSDAAAWIDLMLSQLAEGLPVDLDGRQ